jgi:4-diphosphocytidyl-2-C-methyl-D-erythritol kinase
MESVRTRVIAQAPAKINLVLSVGPLRPDGFHELATIFHAVSLHDQVEARLADEISVTVEGTHADRVPADTSNLAARAAATLAEYAGVQSGARLHIRKAIPVAGGLAGGSADAAAALIACDALWDTRLGRAELLRLAARLGSDVPFSLVGSTALGIGRGELLTSVMVGGAFHWVIAVAAGGLSTPAVYRELDRRRGEAPVSAPAVGHDVLAALRAGDTQALAAALRNDMQDAACTLDPALRTTLATGRDLGAMAGIVSGSGPTCVFLARDSGHALDLAVGLTSASVAADVLRVRGPVPGARLAVPTGHKW